MSGRIVFGFILILLGFLFMLDQAGIADVGDVISDWWPLVLVGIVGLALPGIQGILTILIGAGVLSVASETVYRLLRRLFHRWPAVWHRIERFRDKVAEKLGHKH